LYPERAQVCRTACVFVFACGQFMVARVA
jgi:hypothetical protein